MAIPAIAISAAVTAATSVGVGVSNYLASEKAAGAQKDLEAQQAAQIRADQDRRAAAAAAAASTGSIFGGPRETLSTGLGFGSGTPKGGPNSGRSLLTGMG